MNTKLAVAPKPKQKEPTIEWHHAARIEPGEYPAFCRSTQTYFDTNWRRWVCATQWDILDDSRMNAIAQLTMFFNLGKSKKPGAKSRRRKFWRAWVGANCGRPPLRGQTVSPGIFVRRVARVLVADVDKDFNQKAHSEHEVYSVIREILEWETGMSA